MNIDNDQYEYDELRWLARDTQRSRRRGIWWTAGLVFGAMTLATIYVGREQSPPTDSADENGDAPVVSETSTVTLDSSEELEESLNRIGEALEEISGKLPAAVNLRVFSDAPVEGLSNLVWFVDGTRRVPMVVGDVLWIPEAATWLRLDMIGHEGTDQDSQALRQLPTFRWTTVNRWSNGPRPPSPLPAPELLDPLRLPLALSVGSANCVNVESLGPSTRYGFAQSGHVDIEVEFITTDSC